MDSSSRIITLAQPIGKKDGLYKVELIRVGKWEYPHPELDGGTLDIDEPYLDELKANYDKGVKGYLVPVTGQKVLPVNHEHAEVDPAELDEKGYQEDPSKLARNVTGWVRGIEKGKSADDNKPCLYGYFSQEDPEMKRLADTGQLKFVSAEIDPAWHNPEDGKDYKVLAGLATTAKPYIKRMAPIQKVPGIALAVNLSECEFEADEGILINLAQPLTRTIDLDKLRANRIAENLASRAGSGILDQSKKYGWILPSGHMLPNEEGDLHEDTVKNVVRKAAPGFKTDDHYGVGMRQLGWVRSGLDIVPKPDGARPYLNFAPGLTPEQLDYIKKEAPNEVIWSCGHDNGQDKYSLLDYVARGYKQKRSIAPEYAMSEDEHDDGIDLADRFADASKFDPRTHAAIGKMIEEATANGYTDPEHLGSIDLGKNTHIHYFGYGHPKSDAHAQHSDTWPERGNENHMVSAIGHALGHKPVTIGELEFTRNGDKAYVHRAQVRSAYQGHGYGRHLYEAALRYLADKGVKELHPDVVYTPSAEGVWKGLKRDYLPAAGNKPEDSSSMVDPMIRNFGFKRSGDGIRVPPRREPVEPAPDPEQFSLDFSEIEPTDLPMSEEVSSRFTPHEGVTLAGGTPSSVSMLAPMSEVTVSFTPKRVYRMAEDGDSYFGGPNILQGDQRDEQQAENILEAAQSLGVGPEVITTAATQWTTDPDMTNQSLLITLTFGLLQAGVTADADDAMQRLLSASGLEGAQVKDQEIIPNNDSDVYHAGTPDQVNFAERSGMFHVKLSQPTAAIEQQIPRNMTAEFINGLLAPRTSSTHHVERLHQLGVEPDREESEVNESVPPEHAWLGRSNHRALNSLLGSRMIDKALTGRSGLPPSVLLSLDLAAHHLIGKVGTDGPPSKGALYQPSRHMLVRGPIDEGEHAAAIRALDHVYGEELTGEHRPLSSSQDIMRKLSQNPSPSPELRKWASHYQDLATDLMRDKEKPVPEDGLASLGPDLEAYSEGREPEDKDSLRRYIKLLQWKSSIDQAAHATDTPLEEGHPNLLTVS